MERKVPYVEIKIDDFLKVLAFCTLLFTKGG